MNPSPTTSTEINASEWRWQIVEIYSTIDHGGEHGHQSLAGRTREAILYGAKFIEIETPLYINGDVTGWQTHFYGGNAIFSIKPSNEKQVMEINLPWRPHEPPRLVVVDTISRLLKEDEPPEPPAVQPPAVQPAPRDENTNDMFGDLSPAPAEGWESLF